MKFTAKQISGLVNGAIEGDPDISINKVSKIEEGTPGSISFLSNPLYTHYVYKTEASIVLVNKTFVPEHPVKATLIRVDSAEVAFAKLLEVYNQIKDNKRGISTQCFIAGSARLGENLYVGEFAYIGENTQIGNNVRIHPQVYIGENVRVGNNCTFYPGVKIYRDCVIGNDCTLHSGAVIGSDGFGFAPQSDNNYQKIPQIGNVILEDFVEIGANTTIDRATLGSTIIRKGVKLDNLIQVAHNCEIGENTVIAAQTGISGSTKVGKNCMMAGQVGLAGHLTVADNVKLGAQSGVGSNITEDGAILLGSPAIDFRKSRKNYIHLSNLDEIVKRLNHLEKIVKEKN